MHSALASLLGRYPVLEVCAADIGSAAQRLTECFRGGGKLLICGNGGSAADSEHIVGELMKGFKLRRPLPAETRQRLLEHFPVEGAYLAEHLQGALPAFSLVSQVPLITAFANDVTPELVYAQQVYGYARPGDALLGISTSGNSVNVLHALRVARALDLTTLGLTGRDGGTMRDLCEVTIRAPKVDTLEVQECHLPIYHALCEMLETAFFSN